MIYPLDTHYSDIVNTLMFNNRRVLTSEDLHKWASTTSRPLGLVGF